MKTLCQIEALHSLQQSIESGKVDVSRLWGIASTAEWLALLEVAMQKMAAGAFLSWDDCEQLVHAGRIPPPNSWPVLTEPELDFLVERARVQEHSILACVALLLAAVELDSIHVGCSDKQRVLRALVAAIEALI